MHCIYCGKTLANNDEATTHAGNCPVMTADHSPPEDNCNPTVKSAGSMRIKIFDLVTDTAYPFRMFKVVGLLRIGEFQGIGGLFELMDIRTNERVEGIGKNISVWGIVSPPPQKQKNTNPHPNNFESGQIKTCSICPIKEPCQRALPGRASLPPCALAIDAAAAMLRATVHPKQATQQRKGKICPSCDGLGYLMLADSFDRENGKKCSRCKGTGRLSPSRMARNK